MGGEQTVDIDGRRLRLSNLDKVLYPSTGTTKAEVIDYVARAAAVILPWLDGRPVTRKRWPDGVGTSEHPGMSFFAKALESSAPSWVPRLPIDHATGAKEYPLAQDRATLVWLAQNASLELHVPQWRFTAEGARGLADRLVLDLDPGPGVGLAECARVAGWARRILADMGMTAVPVTSGSKGLHVYSAPPAPAPSEHLHAVAHELARALEADHPELVTSRMAKDARVGRVLIDWSQNNAHKTTICPWSLRGTPEPMVALPRRWEELDDPEFAQAPLAVAIARLSEDAVDPPHAPDLDAYLSKRTPGDTPEPMAEPYPRSAPGRERFVIHEHHARRRHWDLRLEHGGVLQSWAVPRGIPETGSRNALAVRTEDHPLAYVEFAGTIPPGQYGAGTMTIWDTGTYTAEKWRDDEIIVTLAGRAAGPLGGRARIALIRTDGTGERAHWLVHRMKTPRAEGVRAPERLDSPGPPAPMLATAATLAQARDVIAQRRGNGEQPWVEFKWDGVRALAVWEGTDVRLYARSGIEITARYPEIVEHVRTLPPRHAILDGEIVAFAGDGRPDFGRLQERMHLDDAAQIRAARARVPVRYLVFDLLRDEDGPLTRRPLAERRERLAAVLPAPTGPLDTPPVIDDLDEGWRLAGEYGLEGVVVKDPGSRYDAGHRSSAWLKLPFTRTVEAVIGGVRRGKGERADTFGSLLLGVPEPDGRLRYIGRVGTGFTRLQRERLGDLLVLASPAESPFASLPPGIDRDAAWVEPLHVAEVHFAGWTDDGLLRHPRWRGIRDDKRPEDLVAHP